ncbi:MAG: hypothetical protein E7408_02545 [Ruminococcaceae bacterium]|nr:hypothetical protein [Oscillospiraceae bacterium]
MFTTKQLLFGIAAFIGGSSLFTVFVTQITFQDSWFSALLALIVSLLTVWMYTGLIRKFPSKGLLEMHTAVYGKWAGRVLNFLYVLFCLGFAAVSLRNLGDFFTGYIMPQTPMLVVLILFSATCALAAHKGISVILRLAFLFYTFMLLALFLNVLLLFPDMQFDNFLPVFRLGVEAYIKGGYIVTAAPFCEIVVFLILLPYADKNAKIGKAFFLGLLLGALHLIAVLLRDIAVLGTSITFLTEPTYESVRLIHLIDIFSRLEIIFAFILVAMRVFKLSVLFCAILRSIEDTVGKNFEKPGIYLVLISVATIAVSMLGFRTGMTLPEWFRNTGAYLFGIFEIVLPLITLIGGIVRFRKRKRT